MKNKAIVTSRQKQSTGLLLTQTHGGARRRGPHHQSALLECLHQKLSAAGIPSLESHMFNSRCGMKSALLMGEPPQFSQQGFVLLLSYSVFFSICR